MNNCVHSCPLVGWLVSRITQKNTGWISMKLGWRMGLSPKQTLFVFGADQDFFLALFNIMI